MKYIDVATSTPQDMYKLMIGSVIPRPIAFVTTLNEDDSVNLAPFSFYNMVSYQPPLLMVSVQRLDGQMKDTARNILRQKEAVVHEVNRHNLADINQTAASLGVNESELGRTNFTTVDSQQVSTPGVEQALVRFETVLDHHHEIIHQDTVTADLFLLRVVAVHVADNVYNQGKIRADQLKPVSRLAGQDYATLGEIITLERPQ